MLKFSVDLFHASLPNYNLAVLSSVTLSSNFLLFCLFCLFVFDFFSHHFQPSYIIFSFDVVKLKIYIALITIQIFTFLVLIVRHFWLQNDVLYLVPKCIFSSVVH